MNNRNFQNNSFTAKKEKTVGILGGMGPLPTVYLFKKIIELSPAKKDQDHLRVIIDNNPKIPDRVDSILNEDKRIIFHLKKTAKNLKKAGAHFILIPCNTSHFYLKAVQKDIKIPIFNMIKLTMEWIKNDGIDKTSNIGLLATDGTLREKLYQKWDKSKKINWIILGKTEQKRLMNLIYLIKKGQELQKLKSKFKKFLFLLKKKGAEYVILGCSELSLFKEISGNEFKLIDPLEILAIKAIKFAKSTAQIFN